MALLHLLLLNQLLELFLGVIRFTCICWIEIMIVLFMWTTWTGAK